MGRRRVVQYGRYFEDFQVGESYRHHWGRTIGAGECSLFTTWTMNANPLYFNQVYARALGHPDTPVNPLLVMNVVFGLTVEDLSEQALAHLGYWRMEFPRPVYPGDTLQAQSIVIGLKENSNRETGIVYVRTTGRNQMGDVVLDYVRWVMVRKRDAAAPAPESHVPDLVGHVAAESLILPDGLVMENYDRVLAGSPGFLTR